MNIEYAIELLKPYSNRITFNKTCLEIDLVSARPRVNYRKNEKWTTGQMIRFIALIHGIITEYQFHDPKIFMCHICNNSKCINIKHIYIGDCSSNAMDMILRGTHNMKSKTHCPQGHEYNKENTRYIHANQRVCRICGRADSLRRYYKNLENMN